MAPNQKPSMEGYYAAMDWLYDNKPHMMEYIASLGAPKNDRRVNRAMVVAGPNYAPRLYANDEFLQKIGPAQAAGVLVHEWRHVLLDHHGEALNPKPAWRYEQVLADAHEVVINDSIELTGYELPADVIRGANRGGHFYGYWTTDEAYGPMEEWYLEQQKNRSQQDQDPNSQPQQDQEPEAEDADHHQDNGAGGEAGDGSSSSSPGKSAPGDSGAGGGGSSSKNPGDQSEADSAAGQSGGGASEDQQSQPGSDSQDENSSSDSFESADGSDSGSAADGDDSSADGSGSDSDSADAEGSQDSSGGGSDSGESDDAEAQSEGSSGDGADEDGDSAAGSSQADGADDSDGDGVEGEDSIADDGLSSCGHGTYIEDENGNLREMDADELQDFVDNLNQILADVISQNPMPDEEKPTENDLDRMDQDVAEAINQSRAQMFSRAGTTASAAEKVLSGGKLHLGWLKLLQKINPDVGKEDGGLNAKASYNWARARRTTSLIRGVHLPTPGAPRDRGAGAKQKPIALIALDFSQSIDRRLAHAMKDMAQSIPEQHIEARCITFSTYAVPFDFRAKENEAARGGTDFSCIELEARKIEKETGQYPYVICLTDGEAWFEGYGRGYNSYSRSSAAAPTAANLKQFWLWVDVLTEDDSRAFYNGRAYPQVMAQENKSALPYDRSKL